MMIQIAIVEDEEREAATLRSYVDRFSDESGETFGVTHYRDAVSFLENYRPKYDIVFMDIEMPMMNGMEAAEKLRELDKSVVLIFVTNMAQFAVGGYSVGALDFVVKPTTYGNFSPKLRRAVDHLRRGDERKVRIYTPDGTRVVPVSSVKYVEVMDHKIVWHTASGNLTLCGSLKKIEAELPKPDFVRCNHCYIVNLRYVTDVRASSVVVDGEELQVSQSRKKDVLKALAEYL